MKKWFNKIRIPIPPPDKAHSSKRDYNRKREKEVSDENFKKDTEMDSCSCFSLHCSYCN